MPAHGRRSAAATANTGPATAVRAARIIGAKGSIPTTTPAHPRSAAVDAPAPQPTSTVIRTGAAGLHAVRSRSTRWGCTGGRSVA